MTKEFPIKGALDNPNHEAHEAATSMMAKLKSGEISMCGCMGPMYGEPFCPCKMKRDGLEHVMENNPLRKVEEERSAAQWKKSWELGGWLYEMSRKGADSAMEELYGN